MGLQFLSPTLFRVQNLPLDPGRTAEPDWTRVLTGTVSELEAHVGAPEHVHRDGQLDLLGPAGAVVVVQHQRVVLVRARFPGAGGHVALQGGQREGEGRGTPKTASPGDPLEGSLTLTTCPSTSST